MRNRDALLICNNDYVDAPLRALPSSLVDIKEFANILEDPEIGAFNVISLVNQEIQAVRIAIARFCMDRRRDDVTLIYYSGHGIKDESGRLFLALKDTQLGLLSATGLSSQFLLEELSGCRAKSKVVILDCSYAGAILGGVMVPRDIVVLTSSSAIEHSFEESSRDKDQSRHKSHFTSGLIEGLKSGGADLDGDGAVTFNELFLYARRTVEIATVARQTPRIYDLTEEPVIAGRAAQPIFLSYSSSDAEFASALSNELRDAGHKVWIDTAGIAGGDDWRERIGVAIDASKLVLTVLSTEAFNSTWVRRELTYADTIGKPILPVLFRQCQLPSWYELQFGHIQRLDLTGNADSIGREPLLSSVKRVLQSRTL